MPRAGKQTLTKIPTGFSFASYWSRKRQVCFYWLNLAAQILVRTFPHSSPQRRGWLGQDRKGSLWRSGLRFRLLTAVFKIRISYEYSRLQNFGLSRRFKLVFVNFQRQALPYRSVCFFLRKFSSVYNKNIDNLRVLVTFVNIVKKCSQRSQFKDKCKVKKLN